jgi:hypothetical protein
MPVAGEGQNFSSFAFDPENAASSEVPFTILRRDAYKIARLNARGVLFHLGSLYTWLGVRAKFLDHQFSASLRG